MYGSEYCAGNQYGEVSPVRDPEQEPLQGSAEEKFLRKRRDQSEYYYAHRERAPRFVARYGVYRIFAYGLYAFQACKCIGGEGVFQKIPCEHDDELNERLYGEHYYHGICHSSPFRGRNSQSVLNAVTRPAPEYHGRQCEHHDGDRDLENPQERCP